MKNRRNIICLAFTAAFALLFIIFTILVKKVDVQSIGPENTEVGLATINSAVAKGVGVHLNLYEFTQCLGYFALIVALCFAAYTAFLLAWRRSFKKVDRDLYALMLCYAAVAIFYVLFEKVIVNYRPVILDYEVEASYPSSHTLIGLCVFLTAAVQMKKRAPNRVWGYVLACALTALGALTVILRLASGVHWFTDIVGGTLLSGAIISLYITFAYWRKKED